MTATDNGDGSFSILGPDGETRHVKGHLEEVGDKTKLVTWIDGVKSSVNLYHDGYRCVPES